jgi:hypothetical protein
MLLWLIASQNDGLIPVDIPFLERKLSCTGIDLDPLVESGLLIDSSAASIRLARELAHG